MQRTAPEDPPGSADSGQSCGPPGRAPGKDVGGVRPGKPGGPYPAHEGQGRTWFDDCPEQSDGPGSGRPIRIGGPLFQGPPFPREPSPAARPRPDPIPDPDPDPPSP